MALVFALWIPATAVADDVWLKNGDHISGHIIRMEDNELFVQSDQAGDLYIDWENVESLRSDKPLLLRFVHGAEIPKNVGTREEDRITLHELKADGPIDLATIRSINQAELYMKGVLTAGGNSTRGNTNTGALNISGDLLVRYNRHKWTLDAAYNHARAEGEVTVENARGSLRYDYFLKGSFFVLALQTLEQDKFQNLALRSTSTGGIGYEFLDQASHQLIAGTGPGVVYTNFTTEPSFMDPSVTWFLRWYYEAYRDIVKLYHNHQGWQDFGHGSAFRLNATQGIRVKLYEDLNMNLEYTIRLNTDPAPGRKELDTGLVFGLSYEYEK